MTNKFRFLSKKKEKYTGLLSALIFRSNQMNSDKITDVTVGFELKDETFASMPLLLTVIIMKLVFLHKYFCIKNSGIVF